MLHKIAHWFGLNFRELVCLSDACGTSYGLRCLKCQDKIAWLEPGGEYIFRWKKVTYLKELQ